MKDKIVKNWLNGFIVLLFAMIAVGGVTRLTRSGLSIVEWKPFTGFIPPLSEHDWQTQFDLYKQSPEYLQVNSAFSISDYKNIFIWEYLHRVLGRLIFFYALIPGLIFWRKGLVRGSKVFLFCSLVAAQGLVGWLMVKSGLEHAPEVSPFMLALHFFSALTVLVAVFHFRAQWSLPLSYERNGLKWIYLWGFALAFQVFYGCLTSGFKAGFAFNTYPWMGGSFFPAGGMLQTPAWINFFENPSTIQWTHRWMGMSLLILTIMVARRNLFSRPFQLLLGIAALQVTLGILNIIFTVPIPLAVIHQMVATLLILSYFNIVFRLRARE